jgi:hypothetical protein
MHVRFADRLTQSGTIRCTGCSHEVVVRRGETVPRCYCGGHEFRFYAAGGDPGPSRREHGRRDDEGAGTEPGPARD